MRGAVHLAAIAVAALVAGCATSVDVEFEDGQDFSGYRTWDWLPGARSVDALPGEERALDALTSRLVGQELQSRGLVRARDGADLLVGYTLRVRRQLVATNETGAVDLLSSHHSSPSYLVQATQQRVQVHDDGYLRIVVTDGNRERVVWRGQLWARRRGDFAHHLPDAVSRLLGRLPATLPAAADAPSSTSR
jgi:hypothetical protein